MHNRDGSLKEKDGKRGTELIKVTKLEKHYKDIRSRKFGDHKTWKKMPLEGVHVLTTVSTVPLPVNMSRNSI